MQWLSSSLLDLFLRICSSRSFGLNIILQLPTIRCSHKSAYQQSNEARLAQSIALSAHLLQQLPLAAKYSLQCRAQLTTDSHSYNTPGCHNNYKQIIVYLINYSTTYPCTACDLTATLILSHQQLSYTTYHNRNNHCLYISTQIGQIRSKNPTRTNSREQKKRIAGVRSRQRREKKKKYIEGLQESVKMLSGEVERYESEISKCKDELVEAIRTASSQANQHAYTYSQLQRQAHSEDPDIDIINHLLDVLQSRIGANARERQTKLDYYFKQITNSLFPAMHRYLMYCAYHSQDIFAQAATPQSLQNQGRWTRQLYAKLKLSPQQIDGYFKFKEQFRSKREQSTECIRRLRIVRDQMKQQQQVFQRGMYEFRLDLDPVQSALIAVFGQKNKLRRQFCLGEQFDQHPTKKIKVD